MGSTVVDPHHSSFVKVSIANVLALTIPAPPQGAELRPMPPLRPLGRQQPDYNLDPARNRGEYRQCVILTTQHLMDPSPPWAASSPITTRLQDRAIEVSIANVLS